MKWSVSIDKKEYRALFRFAARWTVCWRCLDLAFWPCLATTATNIHYQAASLMASLLYGRQYSFEVQSALVLGTQIIEIGCCCMSVNNRSMIMTMQESEPCHRKLRRNQCISWGKYQQLSAKTEFFKRFTSHNSICSLFQSNDWQRQRNY